MDELQIPPPAPPIVPLQRIYFYRGRSILLAFPPEITRQILDSIHATLLGKLWLCGSSELNSLMDSGSILTRIEWRAGLPSKAIPSFFTRFPHLRQLSIHGKFDSLPSPLWKLLKIMKSLERFELSVQYTYYDGLIGDAYAERIELCPSTSEKDCESNTTEVVLPPNLTSLTLTGYTIVSTSQQESPWLPLKYLPQSLTELTIGLFSPMAFTSRILEEPIENLPLNLVSLTIGNGSAINGHVLQGLPQTLESLSIRNAVRVFDAHIKYFPRCLLSLHLSMAPITAIGLHDLPPKLTHLSISYFYDALDTAPLSNAQLGLNCNAIISSLPPSVTCLSMHLARSYVFYASIVPHHIRHLSLRADRGFSFFMEPGISRTIPTSLPSGLRTFKYLGFPIPRPDQEYLDAAEHILAARRRNDILGLY